jgi:hypothetical protein
MKDEKLLKAITADRDRIAAQLLHANPEWSRLDGMVQVLSGNVKLKEEGQDEPTGDS